MDLQILAIGRWRECPEKAIFQEYSKRCGWKIHLKELEVKQSLPPAKLKEKEAELLLNAVPKKAKNHCSGRSEERK